MRKRSLIWRILAIANAALITTIFVGCPARQDPNIMPPTIMAPPIKDVPFVTIAPYGGNFQHILPPPDPSPKISKDGKSTP